MTDRPKTQSTDRRLADVVREVKIAAADRTDVVVDMRDADRARLELLAQEIQPLLKDIDPADDRFDFGISPGLQPRLWIDAVAHVHMGHDRRVFRFVRDTRLGRVVVSDTSDMTQTADAVGRYIAERVIERERILAGDFEALKAASVADHDTGNEPEAPAPVARDETPETDTGAMPAAASGTWAAAAEDNDAEQTGAVTDTVAPPEKKSGRGAGFVLGASWFILGCVAGAAALLVAFWDRLSAML